MPYRPKKPCAYQGCPELTSERYCQKHKVMENSRYNTHCRDMDAQRFYCSKEWRQKRLEFLTQNPLCQECRRRGRLVKAVAVDHIVPIKQGGALLDDGNLQALCVSCHSAKSIMEGSRFPNRKIRKI